MIPVCDLVKIRHTCCKWRISHGNISVSHLIYDRFKCDLQIVHSCQLHGLINALRCQRVSPENCVRIPGNRQSLFLNTTQNCNLTSFPKHFLSQWQHIVVSVSLKGLLGGYMCAASFLQSLYLTALKEKWHKKLLVPDVVSLNSTTGWVCYSLCAVDFSMSNGADERHNFAVMKKQTHKRNGGFLLLSTHLSQNISSGRRHRLNREEEKLQCGIQTWSVKR